MSQLKDEAWLEKSVRIDAPPSDEERTRLNATLDRRKNDLLKLEVGGESIAVTLDATTLGLLRVRDVVLLSWTPLEEDKDYRVTGLDTAYVRIDLLPRGVDKLSGAAVLIIVE